MTTAIRSYRDLRVWQRAMDLMVACYGLASTLPRSETYGLAGQLRRAALSIPSNIAEGNGRGHTGEYRRFLTIAQGSLNEVASLLEAACRLDYVSGASLDETLALVDHVGRMLTNLQRSLGRGP